MWNTEHRSPFSFGFFLVRFAYRREKLFVPILYQIPAFEAFDDFSDFLESISCETSKTCQVRGSNPCRGATSWNHFWGQFDAVYERSLATNLPMVRCRLQVPAQAVEASLGANECPRGSTQGASMMVHKVVSKEDWLLVCRPCRPMSDTIGSGDFVLFESS
jgi:hypothetical protein